MNANIYFTTADERNDYAQTRKALQTYSDDELQREYHQANKDSFGQLHGRNARLWGNLIVDELLRRGITHLPSIFSPIAVRPFRVCAKP
jgi:hypothetical protein